MGPSEPGTEELVLEGSIAIPYKWVTGRAVGEFLGELRDHGRILGGRCGACGRVSAPPQNVCGRCFRKVEEMVPLSGEGRLVSWTVVRHPIMGAPLDPPYAIGAVRLDGADTEFLHLIRTDALDRLAAGQRMRAIFAPPRSREGVLLDMLGFEPI